MVPVEADGGGAGVVDVGVDAAGAVSAFLSCGPTINPMTVSATKSTPQPISTFQIQLRVCLGGAADSVAIIEAG